MKLRLFLSIFLVSLGSYALANEASDNDVNHTLTSDTIITTKTSTKNNLLSGFSVFLYLPINDDLSVSFPMTESQLTVTPSTTYTGVRAIRIISYNSTTGACIGGVISTTTIDNGVNNTVTLTNGHAYLTTDASNYALSQVGFPFTTWSPTFDNKYELLDNTLTPIGTISGCIGDSTGVCTSSSNCGWTTPQTWTP